MKILLADEFDKRADALIRHLQRAGITNIYRLGPAERLLEGVKKNSPDVVIVDMSRADRDSLEPIREVTASQAKPIVMFNDSDDESFMEEAINAGVSSYNIRGTALPEVKPVVQAAVAIFRRYQKLAGDLQAAEIKLDEQITIQQAKSLLMRKRNMTEPQAYKWLRSRAMDRGRRIADVARDVLATIEQQG